MIRPDEGALDGRWQTGDLILLVQATLDRTDEDSKRAGERASVVAKVVREPDGELAVHTRVTAVETEGSPAAEPKRVLAPAGLR